MMTQPDHIVTHRCAQGLLLLLLILAQHGTARAISQLDILAGDMTGEGWQAEDLRLSVDLAAGSGSLRAARLQLPEPVGELTDLEIRCQRLLISAQSVSCSDAQMAAQSALLDAAGFSGSFQYAYDSGQLLLDLSGIRIGGTSVSLAAHFEAGQWQLALEAPGLGYSSSDGTLATEALHVSLSGSVRPDETGWHFDLELGLPEGQLYVEPVFLDLDRQALSAGLRGHWDPQAERVNIHAFHLDHPAVLQARGSAVLKPALPEPLQTLELSQLQAELPEAYLAYLQPFLIGTALDSLETGGSLYGELTLVAGTLQQFRLVLDELYLVDQQERFSVESLDGELAWAADNAPAQLGELAWTGGSAWQLPFGAAKLCLQGSGSDFQLCDPLHLPLLDGALQVSRLELAGVGGADPQLMLEGALEPISMRSLTQALNWPEFGGTLAGTIPRIEYRQGSLIMDGTLQAEVFAGLVQVTALRLDDPFGVAPALSASIELNRLDLAQVTDAFTFGRIEGRMSGEISDLRLLQWLPTAFDARLYTVRERGQRQRISQRAIENIADLGGGGAGGALSRGALRFFDDFGYSGIALGCRLRNGICQMSGLEPHGGGGYYIVKGRLLPRIDVIGYAGHVSWDSLVEQLRAVVEGDGPVVR